MWPAEAMMLPPPCIQCVWVRVTLTSEETFLQVVFLDLLISRPELRSKFNLWVQTAAGSFFLCSRKTSACLVAAGAAGRKLQQQSAAGLVSDRKRL